jgi:NAD(P)-dependent dehydrogenase (short-subunit alcohol dehydrogenase family)
LLILFRFCGSFCARVLRQFSRTRAEPRMGHVGDDEGLIICNKGVYFLTQKLLPLINDGGRIVNISSGLARFTLPGSSAYGAAKGAVEVLTRYLAKELGPRRITANVVAPGAIQTDFSGGMVL